MLDQEIAWVKLDLGITAEFPIFFVNSLHTPSPNAEASCRIKTYATGVTLVEYIEILICRDYWRIVATLCHELKHAQQVYQQRFYWIDSNTMFFNGFAYDLNSTPYERQPWELEAIAYEYDGVARYLAYKHNAIARYEHIIDNSYELVIS